MMMTMCRGPRRGFPRAAFTLGALLLASLGSVPSAAAQERTERTECRCVDREGNEIDNCRCLRGGGLWDVLALSPELSRSRARLGVTVSPGQPSEDDARGARLESVTPDGPADEAGLREGDILTSVGGKSLFDPLDRDTEHGFDLDRSIPVQRLLAITRKLEPGEEVEIEYLRDGERHTATLEARELSEPWSVRLFGPEGRGGELAERLREFRFERPEGERTFRFEGPRGLREFHLEAPEGGRELRMWTDSAASPGVYLRSLPRSSRYLFGGNAGIGLVDLNPELGEYFGTSRGVLVTEVDESSPLGLRAGDVVLAIGDRDVSDADHLRRILRSYEPDETVTFRIMRQKSETSVQGRLAR